MTSFRFPDKPIETDPTFIKTIKESEWLAQAKYEGWRMLAFIDGPHQVRCLSRVGKPLEDITPKFDPRIYDYFTALGVPNGTVFDAEFLGPRGDIEPSVRIFDCLAEDGTWLTNMGFANRWAKCVRLQALITHSPLLKLAETRDSDFLELFERLKAGWYDIGCTMQYETEGMILKRKEGGLTLDIRASKKSNHMFKIKFRENEVPRH